MYLIYKLTFLNEKSYIGVTSRLQKRLWEHKNRKDNLVGRAWDKYGEPIIQIFVIGEENYIYDLERRIIEMFDTLAPNGYNLMDGGMGGRKMSGQTRRKMSRSHKDKKLSNEHCDNISKGKIGKKRKPFSEKWKQNLSKSKQGKQYGPMSKERRENISKSKKGKILGPMSEYQRERISESKCGKKLSDYHKQQISKGLKEYHSNL